MPTTQPTTAAIVAAALDLAENQGWRNVTLAAIAARSGHSLADLLAEFPTKEAILKAFALQVDHDVLKDPFDDAGTVRDRLFDLLMRRFDALAPRRAALRAILRDTLGDPFAALSGLCALHRSMTLTLEAAGASASGAIGQVRVKALGAIYLHALYEWLQGESDDTDRVMAQIDKSLARAERIATSISTQRERLRERRHARRTARHQPSDVEASAASAADAAERA